MASFTPSEMSIPEVHGFLLTAVSPRPIAFASTVDKEGNPNLAPFSFFNVFSSRPPVMIFSPARSGRTGKTKDTLNNVLEVPEVVINIVNYPMVHQMSLASSPYAPDVNEFEKAGFTPVASETVKPFRVKESPAQFECTVREVISLGDNGGAGQLVIAEVQRFHIHDNLLTPEGKLDPIKLDAVARNGANWYTRANADTMFEVTKPITTIGIGLDQIPEDIRSSDILSGNDLGQLGNVEELPNETDVNEYKLIDLSEVFMDLEDEPAKLEQTLHQRAKDLLSEGKVNEAWMTLLTFNNG
ncbi:MAG: flavin reductase family protein [Flavobacteriales bacterium]